MKRKTRHLKAGASHFDRVRRLVRSSFGDAVRETLSNLTAALRQVQPTANETIIVADQPSPAWLKECTTLLVADVSGRILCAQREMDRQTAACAGAASVPGFVESEAPPGLENPILEAMAVRLATAISAKDAEAYRRYARSVHAISPRRWHLDQFSPLGALVFARALITCLADCLANEERRVLLAPVLFGEAVDSIFGGVVLATDFLQEAGVEPSSEAVGFAYQAYADPASEFNQRPQAQSVGAPQLSPEQAKVRSSGKAARSPRRRVVSVGGAALAAKQASQSVAAHQSIAIPSDLDDEALGLAVASVASIEADAESFARSVNEFAYSRGSRQRYFALVRAALSKEECAPSQLAAVELVGAMFDYVIDDRLLQSRARGFAWRMQRPAVMLALLDPGFLGNSPRSLRRLLDKFGALVGADGFDASLDSAQMQRLETIVRAVESVSERLAGRIQILSGQIGAEYRRSAASVGQLVEQLESDRRALEATPERRNRRDVTRRPSLAKEQRATEVLTSMLTRKTAGVDLPDSVEVFLQSVWMRYLRSALLREGCQGEHYQQAEQLVDDLIWTLRAEPGAGSRRELAQRIPAIIQQVNYGLHEVGAREEDHQAFFDELFLIHLRKLQRADRTSQPKAPDGVEVTEATEATEATDFPVLDSTISDSRLIGDGFVTEPDPAPPTLSVFSAGPATITDTVTGQMTSQLGPVLEAQTSIASNDENVTEVTRPIGRNHMLEVLQAVDMEDLPGDPVYKKGPLGDDLADLVCGAWLEYRHTSGRIVHMKVAWLSEQRTVALLVRHPDRRALSRPMSQLRDLIAGGRLRLLHNVAAA